MAETNTANLWCALHHAVRDSRRAKAKGGRFALALALSRVPSTIFVKAMKGSETSRRSQVEIAAELAHEFDAEGKRLSAVKVGDLAVEQMRTLCTGLEKLSTRCADAGQRGAISYQPAEPSIDFPHLGAGREPEAELCDCFVES